MCLPFAQCTSSSPPLSLSGGGPHSVFAALAEVFPPVQKIPRLSLHIPFSMQILFVSLNSLDSLRSNQSDDPL
jgi:hypothetical protein